MPNPMQAAAVVALTGEEEAEEEGTAAKGGLKEDAGQKQQSLPNKIRRKNSESTRSKTPSLEQPRGIPTRGEGTTSSLTGEKTHRSAEWLHARPFCVHFPECRASPCSLHLLHM